MTTLMTRGQIEKLKAEHSKAIAAFHAQRLEAAAYFNLAMLLADALSGKADPAKAMAEFNRLIKIEAAA